MFGILSYILIDCENFRDYGSTSFLNYVRTLLKPDLMFVCC